MKVADVITYDDSDMIASVRAYKKGAVRQGLAEVTKIGGLFFGLVTADPPLWDFNGGDCLRQFRKFKLETATLYSYHTVRNYSHGYLVAVQYCIQARTQLLSLQRVACACEGARARARGRGRGRVHARAQGRGRKGEGERARARGRGREGEGERARGRGREGEDEGFGRGQARACACECEGEGEGEEEVCVREEGHVCKCR